MNVRSAVGAALRILQKDPRLIAANIRERIVFDLVNRVDTIRQVPKAAYAEPLANLVHGLHYSSSWTSEIKFGFDAATARLGSEFGDFTFIDVGCGKGKVQIYWSQALRRRKLIQPVYGLDYYQTLLSVANENHRRVFGRDGNFIQADAAVYDFGSLSRRLIVYLYNPFDDVVLKAMLERLDGCEVVIIYNNPEHDAVLVDSGFTLVREKIGFHPQATTRVFYRAA